MLRSKLWLAAALLLLTIGAASAVAQAAPSDKGLIVFSRLEKPSGPYSLFTVAPDTGQLRRVMRGCGWEWYPAWSPDGRRIAFSRLCGRPEPPKSNLDLYVVGVNGKGLRRLVHTRTNDLGPTWSPDGSKIAFESGEPQWSLPNAVTHSRIWVVGANGHGLKRLTNSKRSDFSPAWSPDGKWIAFVRDIGRNRGRIWLVSADGRNAHPLGLKGGEPAWSPDGAQLAFARGQHGVATETVDLYVANADGSGLRRLTHARAGVVNHHPSWSPDGHSIVYIGQRGLYTINVNGHGARRLTRSPAEDIDPDWSKPVVFSANG
jgi:TolB protein